MLSNLKWTEKGYTYIVCGVGNVRKFIQDNMLLQNELSVRGSRVHMSGQLGEQQGTGGVEASTHTRSCRQGTLTVCSLEKATSVDS